MPKYKNYIPDVNNIVATDIDDIRQNFYLLNSINYVYVDQVNGNDNNDGSLAYPFKTLSPVFYETAYGSVTYCKIIGNYKIDTQYFLDGNKIVILEGNEYDTTNNVPTNKIYNDPNQLSFIALKNNSIIHIRKMIIEANQNNGAWGTSWNRIFKIVEGKGSLIIGLNDGTLCDLNINNTMVDIENALGFITIQNSNISTTLTSNTNLITNSANGIFIYSEYNINDTTGGVIIRPARGIN